MRLAGWLGIIRLYAPDPAIDRLDVTVAIPGQEGNGIAYRIWPRPGRSVEGLELVFLVMPPVGGPSLVRRPIEQEEGGLHLGAEDEVRGFAVCARRRGPLCLVRAG